MNDLIGSSSSWGKIAQCEEIYQMICILCESVKHHMTREA